MEDRIRIILKAKNITAATFADKIGVQRSAISHIFSGRNNPSLDFLQRILKAYPDINAEWLMNGRGEMYRDTLTLFNTEAYTQPSPKLIEKQTKSQTTIFNTMETQPISNVGTVMNKLSNINQIVEDTTVRNFEQKNEAQLNTSSTPEMTQKPVKKIERIIVFFTDKSFSEYSPE